MSASTVIGYDPGGNRHHGVAELIVTAGAVKRVETWTMPTAEDVIRLIESQAGVGALGVDTLACWFTGHSGWRPADRWLRDHYPAARDSVVPANSLYGSMALNGMAVLLATRHCHPAVLITETHPKVLYHQMSGRKYDYVHERSGMDDILAEALGTRVAPANDHEWDAALSAFAALQSLRGLWQNDLLCLPIKSGERLTSPCDDTHYFWPE